MVCLALFVVVAVYAGDLAPHRLMVGKVRTIFIAFLDNLILHQNLTSGSFLKVSCHAESETLSYYVTLKSICLSHTLNGSFAHA